MDSKLLPKEVPSLALEYNFIKPKIPLFHRNHDQTEICGRLLLCLKILIKAIYVCLKSHQYELCRLNLSFFNYKLIDLKEVARE